MKLILQIIIFCAVFNCIAQEGMSPKEKFFEINGRLVETSVSLEENFAQSYSEFLEVAKKNPKKYKSMVKAVNEMALLVDDFVSQMEALKQQMASSIKDPKDYAAMNKSTFVDSLFFEANNISKGGLNFISNINNFRTSAVNLGKAYPQFVEHILTKFSTEDPVRNGEQKNWLVYNFKGFPLVATLTRITSLQADAKYTRQLFLKALLGQK